MSQASLVTYDFDRRMRRLESVFAEAKQAQEEDDAFEDGELYMDMRSLIVTAATKGSLDYVDDYTQSVQSLFNEKRAALKDEAWKDSVEAKLRELRVSVVDEGKSVSQLFAEVHTAMDLSRTNILEMTNIMADVQLNHAAVDETRREVDYNTWLQKRIDEVNTTVAVAEAVASNAGDVPIIGGSLVSAADGIAIAASAGAKVLAFAKAHHLGTIANFVVPAVKEFARLRADMNRLEDNQMNGVQESQLHERMLLEASKAMKSIAKITEATDEEIKVLDCWTPTWHYYLAPLQGLRASEKFLGSYLRHGPFTLDQLFDASNVSAHGFIVLRWPMEVQSGATMRVLQLTFSTGDFNSFGGVGGTRAYVRNIITGKVFTENEIGWCLQIREKQLNQPWSTTHELGCGGSKPRHESAIEASSGKFWKSSDLVFEFIKEYQKTDLRPYNAITNNCQSQAKTVLRYVLQGARPHWWTSKNSAALLRASMLPGEPVPSVIGGSDYNMPLGGYPHGDSLINGIEGIAGHDEQYTTSANVVTAAGVLHYDGHITAFQPINNTITQADAYRQSKDLTAQVAFM